MKSSSKGLQIVYLFLSIMISMLFASINGTAAIFNVTDEMELRDALDTAAMNNEDDGIIIAAGTYNTNGLTFSYLPIGTEDFTLTIVGAGAELTILDGGGVNQVLNIDGDGVTEDNNSDIDISGLTIQNGNSVESGAGLFVRIGDNLVEPGDPEVTIENCIFMNNETLDDGGGADVSAPVMNLINSTFTNNSAVGEGGGASLGRGAGIVTLTDNIFTNNTSNDEGGGASIGGGGLVALLTGNTFTDNSADEGGGADIGGGGANVTLDSNTFIGNSALSDGGGTSISGGSLITVLTNNIFVDNTAIGNGGGCEIRGGGITATLTNNTLTLNSASGVGGGLNIVLLQGTELANIFNNIVYNNTATGDGDDIFVDDDFDEDLTGSPVNLFNNDFSDFHSKCENTMGCTSNVTSSDNIDADPLFINAIGGNVGITSGSPVIDAGDPAAPDLPATDFLGNARIIGPAPDIGAIEFTGMFLPGDANGDGVINILDVTAILNDILGVSPATGNADCNEDLMVNILDVTCVLNIILGV